MQLPKTLSRNDMVLMPPSEGISSNSNDRLRRKVWGESHSNSSLTIWSLNTFCNVVIFLAGHPIRRMLKRCSPRSNSNDVGMTAESLESELCNRVHARTFGCPLAPSITTTSRDHPLPTVHRPSLISFRKKPPDKSCETPGEVAKLKRARGRAGS